MREPEMDADGYPTKATLRAIRTWDVRTFADAYAAMDFAGRAWSYPQYWRCWPRWRVRQKGWRAETVRRYTFSTGGWSGNEAVVGAIQDNVMLTMLGAWSWHRGGHYEYRFPVEPAP